MQTLETLISTRFSFSSIFVMYTSSYELWGGSASRRLFSRSSNTRMANNKTIFNRKHIPMIIRGTWLLGTISVAVGCQRTSTTYRGLYLFFHIKVPAALPMEYVDNMMAFVVILFVCPAVVCDTQLKANRLPVPPVAD
jgi:hypothetical protein